MHRATVRRVTATVTLVLVLVAACSSGSDRTAPSTSTASTTAPAGAGTTLEPDGASRGVPDAFFGFNGASIVQTVNVDLLLDPALQSELREFPTRLLRVPTGTAAQWIDWRTGRFIEDPTSPFASIPSDRRPVTMDDWTDLLEATGATPVWDLNVLNATLDDQVAMLEAARARDLTVDHIELGNELWDPRSIYPDVYPSGTAYAEKMNTWIPVLRERFPDARIAVAGADPSDPLFASFGPRYVDWNREVLATIKDADAIAIHPYWTLPDGAPPGSSVAATLVAGLDAWNDVRDETLAEIPADMEVWLTEWNQAAWGAGDGTQIWAQALSVVAVGLEQLLDDRITMSLVHDIVDGVRNPHDVGISITFPMFANGARGSTAMEPTGPGHALPLLFGAVAPGSTVRRLQLRSTDEHGSHDVGGHAGVRGVLVEGSAPGAVIVNLTDAPVRVALDGSLAGRWTATRVSAAPDAEPAWVPDDEVTTDTSPVNGSLEVPAYSVTRLARP